MSDIIDKLIEIHELIHRQNEYLQEIIDEYGGDEYDNLDEESTSGASGAYETPGIYIRKKLK